MKVLLIIAHGSRNAGSVQEIKAMTEQVQQRLQKQNGTKYANVEYCFLELAQPNISDTLSRLIKSGAQKITVLPYFLAQGNHVLNDIPGIIDQARLDNPGVEITSLPHIGANAQMIDLITSHI